MQSHRPLQVFTASGRDEVLPTPPPVTGNENTRATVEGAHGVVFAHLDTTLLDEVQVAWVLGNLMTGKA